MGDNFCTMEKSFRELRPHKKYSKKFNSLLDIAFKKSIDVCALRFEGNMDGLWIAYPDGDEIILIDTYRRKGKLLQFILAHEIAHSILHKGTIDSNAYPANSRYRKRIEQEADEYAHQLLGKLAEEGATV